MSETTVWLTPKLSSAHTKCNVITLRRAVKAGKLQAFRVNGGGGRVRFRAADLDRWLASYPAKGAAS